MTQRDRFHGLRILVVEDEYLLASALAERLEDAGAEVVGPVGTVRQALSLASDASEPLHGATLDVNLHGLQVFPVADALRARGIPFVFCTGYDVRGIPDDYQHAPRLEKPIDPLHLLQALSAQIVKAGSAA